MLFKIIASSVRTSIYTTPTTHNLHSRHLPSSKHKQGDLLSLLAMDHPKKSNKISDIVRLQQILKKWRKAANAPKSSSSSTSSGNASKSIKFIKRTLSFTDLSLAAASSSNDAVPKGYLAVCVGKQLKRYIIPTEYLGHQAFGILLREAEEEFGFQQEGVLKIPCEVAVFEKILKVVEEKKDVYLLNESGSVNSEKEMIGCYNSPECELTPPSHHPQMCR